MGTNKKRSRRKPGSRNYADYSEEMLEVATNLVREKVISSYEAEKQFGIPRRTIVNKAKNMHIKPFGRPTELSVEEETHIADVVNVSAEFGCPLTLLDLRIVVHNYLMKSGKTHLFKGKMPGERWARDFLVRHKFSQRATQNIKKSRAAKTVEEMNEYYKNLEISLKDVPASNILNFDETNLSDDPGSKKCIFKRGTKHPERVMNSSKSSVSIMFSGTADGNCLPPYVVYKADHLWSRWCENGPRNARYNRTKSGWFDMVCFDDWFKTIVLPWAISLDGVKVIIGDNLASHLSVETIQICQNQNIRFVFLPKNSTHLTQPLDVAFFGPMKRHWREILANYKATHNHANSINKCHFPQLLQQLISKLNMTQETNLCKGFQGSGIYPFNPSKVIVKIPTAQNICQFDASLLEFLQLNRQPQPLKTGQNKKLLVVPGKSISTEEAEELSKSKKAKKNKKINKQKFYTDSNLPGSSKMTAVKKTNSKQIETQSLRLRKVISPSIEPTSSHELDIYRDSALEKDSAQSLSSLKKPDSLCRLCIRTINMYLPTLIYSNNHVHYLTNLQKNSIENSAFCGDIPECFQSKGAGPFNNNSDLSENSSTKNKIIILSNILIKEASEERTVLQNINTQINKNKRKLHNTTQTSKLKRKKKRVYTSDSSLTSEMSYLATDIDDSDYENFDNYIASCLEEQEEQEDQENVCPFGLNDIDFYSKNVIDFQEGTWIIVKYATRKSVKHFIGKVLSIDNKIPTVTFVRKVKSSKCNTYTYPNIEDICAVHDLNDIVMVLPNPLISRRGHFTFNLKLDKYNIQ